MFRPRLSRRVLCAGGAVVATRLYQDKPPIYSPPENDLVLVEQPTVLERRIGDARRAVTSAFCDTRNYIHGWVSGWIAVEHSVENRIKSLIPADERLTPGALYVGVSALTGSIIARNRSFAMRFLLPPTLFILSFDYFLPKTYENVADYVRTLEYEYVPRFAQIHYTSLAHSAMAWQMAKDSYERGKDRLTEGLGSAVSKMQDVTGLKFNEAFGWSQQMYSHAESRANDLSKAIEQKTEEAKEVADEKIKDIKKLM